MHLPEGVDQLAQHAVADRRRIFEVSRIESIGSVKLLLEVILPVQAIEAVDTI